ncbi:MAG: NTP transferase domain-containing protein, partial [Marinobacter adhaerens]|uniref:NTP transferase domain-containing protein n=1 Tax=Marinobacter adhaerens TaxID=1033846 RepID=UPI003C4C974D
MNPLHVVILAAGQGSRMKSALPKVLHPVAGKPMLHHVVDTAKQLGAEKIHTVIGHGADQVRASLHDDSVNWVLQTEQLGTGHAVAQALPDLPDNARVLILYGDVPLTRKDTLEAMVSDLDDSNLALLTVDMDNPHGYGRIVRNDQGQVQAIVEQKDANAEQLKINEVNTGVLALGAHQLNKWLPQIDNNNAQQEYYLTDLIALARKDG